jgi:hypothetical protein
MQAAKATLEKLAQHIDSLPDERRDGSAVQYGRVLFTSLPA